MVQQIGFLTNRGGLWDEFKTHREYHFVENFKNIDKYEKNQGKEGTKIRESLPGGNTQCTDSIFKGEEGTPEPKALAHWLC